MTIKYIPEGDLFRASQLWGEGRHQLSILKNAMNFQKLKQDQRLVSFADGTIIKCLSCFGQDVINIFVPQVFVGGEPEYREREEITYYPAIEVYDGIAADATYLGIVLCKGGGFEPPYEFIKKDSLPEDYYTEPLGELPEERIWFPENNRRLQDIVPNGIAGVELAVASDPSPSIDAYGDYHNLIVRAERSWDYVNGIWCWNYRARATAHYSYSRSEALRHDYVFSYSLPGDADPGDWPPYVFEGLTHQHDKKPTNALSLTGTLYWDVQGSGNNNFWKLIRSTYYDVHAYAMKFVVDGVLFGIPFGHWERDDVNVNFDSITLDAIAQAESFFAEHGDPQYREFVEFSDGSKRVDFYLQHYDYSYTDDLRRLWDFIGSVMDGTHYALAYSMKNDKKQANCYRSIEDITKCIQMLYYPIADECLEAAKVEDIITDEQTEGPLCVVVDGVIFEILPETAPEISPRFQSCDLKYFRVGGRSIGLFRIAKNYNLPFDYIYIYAEVLTNDLNLTSEAKSFVDTNVIPNNVADAYEAPQIVGDSINRFTVQSDLESIVYMKDAEGNILYGKGGLRLIKEEITIKEMATAEQPGLFREII